MQDSDNGYIQIPRAHPIWYFKPYDLRVALELIRRATHKDITFRHHGVDIQLKRGQLFIAMRQLSRDCGIDREALRRVFQRLICTHFCTHSCTHLGFIVTICDYNHFNNAKYLPAPTSAPTNAPIVGGQTTHSGRFDHPPIYNEQGTMKINNLNDSNNKDKDYVEPTGRKPMTYENFDKTEIPGLVAMFGTRAKCSEHLKNRGFIQEAVQMIVEEIFKEPAKGGPLSEVLRRC